MRVPLIRGTGGRRMSSTVEIIAIGDEILRGVVAEHNTTCLATVLTSIGLEPKRISVLPDDIEVIASELAAAIGRSGVVLVTGGLGPTVDDVTKDAAIKALGLETEVRVEIVDGLASRFRVLGREMPDAYRDQGRVPKGAVILPNTVGAAVGMRLEAGTSELFLLPGVPAEMRAMFKNHVLPGLAAPAGDSRRRLRTFGLTETEAENRLRNLIDGDLFRTLSIISSPSGVDVYLPSDLGAEVLAGLERELGSFLYATGEETLEEVVFGLLETNRNTLAVAESVTGGLVTHLIVSIPGASRFFIEGFVAYSNEAKVERLGVDARSLQRYGAVSGEVCVQMATGARERTGSDFALSTTGIAGPDGGSEQKPVGLCYVGLAAPGECFREKLMLTGDRNLIRRRTAYRALDLLRLGLVGDRERLKPFRAGR